MHAIPASALGTIHCTRGTTSCAPECPVQVAKNRQAWLRTAFAGVRVSPSTNMSTKRCAAIRRRRLNSATMVCWGRVVCDKQVPHSTYGYSATWLALRATATLFILYLRPFSSAVCSTARTAGDGHCTRKGIARGFSFPPSTYFTPGGARKQNPQRRRQHFGQNFVQTFDSQHCCGHICVAYAHMSHPLQEQR